MTIVHDVTSLKKRHLDPTPEIALLSRSETLIVHKAARFARSILLRSFIATQLGVLV